MRGGDVRTAWVVLAAFTMVTVTVVPAAAASVGAPSEIQPAVDPLAALREDGSPADPGAITSPASMPSLQETLLVRTDATRVSLPGDNVGRAVEAAADGTRYLVGGTTGAPGSITKLDPNGHVAWRFAYDAGLERFQFAGLQLDAEGDLYAAGYGSDLTSSDPSDWRFGSALVKLDPSGDLVWERTFRIDDTDSLTLVDVAVDDLGDTVAAVGTHVPRGGAGEEGWSLAVRAFSTDGDERWRASSDAAPRTVGYRGVYDGEGHLHVAGYASQLGGASSDGLYVAFGPDGAQEGIRNLGLQDRGDYLTGVDVGPSGEVVLTGFALAADASDGRLNTRTLSLTPDGDLDWAREMSRAGTQAHVDVTLRADGTAVAAGATTHGIGFDPNTYQGLIEAYSSDGIHLWTHTKIHDAAGAEILRDIDPTVSGYLIAGSAWYEATGQDPITATYLDAYSPVASAAP